jgi:imidazole glycerol-phosphate synthase subunit HisH
VLSPPEIALVDYGAGNLRSVAKALERAGLKVAVTGDPEALPRASAVVLPGAGAFTTAAERMRARGLVEAVAAARAAGRPYLGLCLGLQLMFDESDEHGPTPGFGWMAGRVERFPAKDAGGAPLRVPHIGWNRVRFAGAHPMLAGLPPEDDFYFVHGYRAVPRDRAKIVGTTEYGGPFAAAVADEGAFAVQFHPEKSQWAGKRLLDAFASWVRSS